MNPLMACGAHGGGAASQVEYDPTRACRLMQQDLVACQSMDVQCSGATCVLAVFKTANKTLTVSSTSIPPLPPAMGGPLKTD